MIGRLEPSVRARSCALALIALTLVSSVSAVAASRPAVRGRGGAVVSPEAQSTEVGLDILRRGGNAVDGAVATALAMAVVHPEAGNLGGGGFAVVRMGQEIATLDFRETAPAAASRDMYLDSSGEPLAEASRVGGLAAGVPGSPKGLYELHQRFGALPWADVVKPAAALAGDGFIVSRRLREALEEEEELLARFPASAAVWLPEGKHLEIGSTHRIPALAAVLTSYGERGPAAIVTGRIADAVERAAARYGGILKRSDLEAYQPVWREPVRFSALGWQFAAMDLPSSGGFLVGATLELAERLGWPGAPRGGAARAHLLAEIWRRSFADRTLLGDPGSTDAKVTHLLADAHLSRVALQLDRTRATASNQIGLTTPPRPERDETNHLSVIDRWGNVVAMTTTLNGGFGCGVLVPEGGFLLNNEMDDFATVPGRANLYGLIQGSANEVAPGRRMLSSMSPTVGWRGRETIALGGRGGSRIPTAVSQVLLNVLADGDPLQAGIDRPRIHHQWLPDKIFYEPDALAPETRQALENMGHELQSRKHVAKVHAARLLANGRMEAAGDPRGPAVGGVVEPEP